jgi:hypothetical protein
MGYDVRPRLHLRGLHCGGLLSRATHVAELP